MEDGVCGGGPQEGPATGVVVVGEAEDLFLELFDGGEGAAANGLPVDDVEPDPDLVKSRRIGGSEVEMEACPARPEFLVQAHEALAAEAFAPPADRLADDADPLGHRQVAKTLGPQQHELTAAHPG